MADLQSRPYKPNPQLCCEACAFGRGEHAEWCWVCIDHELHRLADDGCPHAEEGH